MIISYVDEKLLSEILGIPFLDISLAKQTKFKEKNPKKFVNITLICKQFTLVL